MRITNMLHFTENHRFYIYREFSLSGVDDRMLGNVYQPMVGGFAISIYSTLCRQLPLDQVGFSPLEQQRKLFLSLDLEPGERGRKFFVEQTSKLEAVGLLQTTRRFLPLEEDYIYEYQLFQPLPPQEFFKNQHLTLLLRDKVGKFALLSIKDALMTEEPAGISASHSENLSVPFYDLFRLNTQVIDYELEQALFQTAPSRQSVAPLDVISKGFDYASIITRFPRGSRNRDFIEALKFNPVQLAEINIIAKKYDLTLQETCRLLDEDDVFLEDGELQTEVLQYKANLSFRQSKKREEQLERNIQRFQADPEISPERMEHLAEKSVEMAYYLDVPTIFHGQCDIHQYNMLLRNEPYTLVLKRFFSQGSVPDGVLDIFEKIDLNYKLEEEVINVLIHYIHTDRRSWAKSSIEAVASDLLGKQVGTYEQAVEYVRERIKFKEKAAARAGNTAGGGKRTAGGRSSKKPNLPIVEGKQDEPLTAEELEDMQRLVEELEGKKI